ncbi:asparagine synthase (glutamine-hydrolyzing) [Candidatus Uhrbacteria bacterium]|nr:asparagine synthase (glutamine-hydrolyzing) [Candidatus Uhrbacteria bacterium]
MCGIAGIVKPDKSLPEEGLLRKMSQAIASRGPDGEGLWLHPGIGLAHRRLAIIDLSPEAAQPMRSSDGELTIVFNGEIYNYKELRAGLEARGAKFRTQSDTEVILESYRAYGEGCLKKFRGMFALAIWDAPRSRLFVARDRIGKKPFFYAVTPDGSFLFASEIKALAQAMELKPDWQAVRLFLGLQYVPAPRTGFEGVKQLLPGTYGIFDSRGWHTEVYNDWSSVKPLDMAGLDDKQLAEELRAKLDEAVKIRQLTADVSVGAFLSGGVDSAAMVALASKYTARPLQTFTMGFPVLKMDERREARTVAELFKTDHFEFEAKAEDLLLIADELVGHYDAPYADSSALPLWLLSRATAREIKVVLTGDGGDELFGGYRRYTAYEQAMNICRTPMMGKISAPVSSYIGSLLHDVRFQRMGETLKSFQACRASAYGELFCGSYFSTQRLRKTFSRDFLERTEDADAVEFVAARMGDESSLDAAMRFDLTSYLPDDLNVKMDRATMRFGLEARSPMLDQEIVAWALALPIAQKVHKGNKKIILRKALQGIVPDEVLNRPKRGFQVPLAEWFRGPLRESFRERCLGKDSRLSGIADLAAIERLIQKNDRGFDHGNRLWMLFSLATWLGKYA